MPEIKGVDGAKTYYHPSTYRAQIVKACCWPGQSGDHIGMIFPVVGFKKNHGHDALLLDVTGSDFGWSGGGYAYLEDDHRYYWLCEKELRIFEQCVME